VKPTNPTPPVTIKNNLHPRNAHRNGYDFDALCDELESLKVHVVLNPKGQATIDFSKADSVLELNKAILKLHYNIGYWTLPKNFLCPPIPGRVDYVHYLADLIAETTRKKLPKGQGFKVLDIGTGANLVYPILMNRVYGWSCVGTDINETSLENSNQILFENKSSLKGISLKQQMDSNNIFKGILSEGDYFHATICNPPFHKSQAESEKGTIRKLRNLSKGSKPSGSIELNFGGQNGELWCPGGELSFILKMVAESRDFSKQVGWFTSLISKQDTVERLTEHLSQISEVSFRFISMSQGQKRSRFVAWTYKSSKELKQLSDLGEMLPL